MTDRLQQMGIQRWYLRQSLTPVQPIIATTELPQAAPVEEKPLAIQEPLANNDPSAWASKIAKDREPNNFASNKEQLSWLLLEQKLSSPDSCASCQLSTPILGQGDRQARWVFVIDSPSPADIGLQLLASGRAGQLFDAILAALQLNREAVYFTSVFKCPPAQAPSANPQCDELIHQQIKLIQPDVVVTLGEFTAQWVVKSNHSLEQLRQESLSHYEDKTPIVATYSLQEMLQQPLLKGEVWKDLKQCLSILN